MEYFLNPEVIKAASESALGIFSLMILIVGLISLIFFAREKLWAKLVVFSMLFIGVIGYGYSIQLEGNHFKEEQEEAKVAKIKACVAKKIDEYQSYKNTSVVGGARAKGPGWKGGKNTATENVCHKVGVSQKIISATTSNISCHGGRCSVTDPKFSENSTRVCVTTKAWSESKSGGGGGSGQYRLNVVYIDVATIEIKDRFLSVCTSEAT